MKKLRTAVAVMTLVSAPALLIAQRGPEPQGGTGQNNPDIEHSQAPSGKSEQPSTSNAPSEQGTGQNSPDTQQTQHSGSKQKHKKHGGSHNQASPQG